MGAVLTFMDTVYILGAGFSAAGGLPTQAEFSRQLLMSADNDDASASGICSQVISEFYQYCFGWRGNMDSTPTLEDVFTMIDLSAGSGHNLGIKYTPKKLRALRRILIFSIFNVLDKYQVASQSAEIQRFVQEVCDEQAGFVVMNWDIVLESAFKYTNRRRFHYCIPAKSWGDGATVDVQQDAWEIAKIHGSSNWLYCDNCHGLFYDPYQKITLAEGSGLTTSDFRQFRREFTGSHLNGLFPDKTSKCPACASAVGPHIATFSFKKSFRTHAFLSSWQAAERLLVSASNWVFIGYSIPDADYEFRHLLKTISLRHSGQGRPNYPKRITAVFLKDKGAQDRFSRFFGSQQVEFYQGGLAGYLNARQRRKVELSRR